MGLWLGMILLCASPQADSCLIITSNELMLTKDECFIHSTKKTQEALKSSSVYKAKPMCQIIPSVVLPEIKKGKNI